MYTPQRVDRCTERWDHTYCSGGTPLWIEVLSHVTLFSRSQGHALQVFQALCSFDSRATSLLLKDLSKAGAAHRAVELFDWLRSLDEGSPWQSLCDVYTYTAMIAQCIYQQVSFHLNLYLPTTPFVLSFLHLPFFIPSPSSCLLLELSWTYSRREIWKWVGKFNHAGKYRGPTSSIMRNKAYVYLIAPLSSFSQSESHYPKQHNILTRLWDWYYRQ